MPRYRTGVVVSFDHSLGSGLVRPEEAVSGVLILIFRQDFGRFVPVEGREPNFVAVKGYQRKVKVGSRIRFQNGNSYPPTARLWGYESDWAHAEKLMRVDPMIRLPKNARQAEEWGWLYAGSTIYRHEQEQIRALVPEYRFAALDFTPERYMPGIYPGIWVLPIWEVPREARHELGHLDHLGSYLHLMKDFQIIEHRPFTTLVQPPKGWTRHQVRDYYDDGSDKLATVILSPSGREKVVITYDPDGYGRAKIISWTRIQHECTERCIPAVQFPIKFVV